jgi:hypothetical protein
MPSPQARTAERRIVRAAPLVADLHARDWTASAISDELNRQHAAPPFGALWDASAVRTVLATEKPAQAPFQD